MLDTKDTWNQYVWLVIYVAVLALVVRRWSEVRRDFMRDRVLLIFLALVTASVFWGGSTLTALRRVVALDLTGVAAMYVTSRYGLRQVVVMVGAAAAAATALSLLACVFLPSYGMMNTQALHGNWRGIFAHKSLAARNFSLFVVVFVALAAGARGAAQTFWGCALGLAAFLLLKTDGQTAVASSIVTLGMMPFYRSLRLHHTVLLPLLLVFLSVIFVAGWWAAFNLESATKMLGRNATFTGRTLLWTGALEAVAKRPILGYGYDSFWLPGAPGEDVWKKVGGWVEAGVGHCHNGYIDILLSVGCLGGLIFFGHLFRNFAKSLLMIVNCPKKDVFIQISIPTLLTLFFLSNLANSEFLCRNDVEWFLLVVFAVYLSKNEAASREPLARRQGL